MEDAAMLAYLLAFGGYALYDLVRPARRFPAIARWRLKGVGFFVLSTFVSGAAAAFAGEHLAGVRLFDLEGAGVIGGAIIGLLAFQLATYWWHRALHRVPFLWRIHQLHHSAERIDVYGAPYMHPLDTALFAVASTLGITAIGIRPEAAVLASGFGSILTIVQHANIRTPRWLGWLIARPEMHAIHHERGAHRYNYGDIALWDMVFGTNRNPATWEGVGGFYDGGSTRLLDMLAFRDVSEPRSSRQTPPPSALAPDRAAA